MNQQPMYQPFVYIVDSPSNNDLYDGYSIGMALRDTLRAIRIPCIYKLSTDFNTFQASLSIGLKEAISVFQVQSNLSSYPFIHLCTHGFENGIVLTNNTFIDWQQLKKLLLTHKSITGFEPYICMASCNGYQAINMANAFDKSFSVLIGNTGIVLQSDLMVAYLSFYNHLFYKSATFEQAVRAMRSASGNQNFYYALGDAIRRQKLAEINFQQPIFNF